MSESTERQELEELIQMPGWSRLRAYAETEWQGQLGDKLAQAVGATDDALALQQLRQILVAKREIARLLQWPVDRVAALKRAEPPAIAGSSRRGRL